MTMKTLVVLPSSIKQVAVQSGVIPSGYYVEEQMGRSVPYIMRTYIGADLNEIGRVYQNTPSNMFFVNPIPLKSTQGIELW